MPVFHHDCNCQWVVQFFHLSNLITSVFAAFWNHRLIDFMVSMIRLVIHTHRDYYRVQWEQPQRFKDNLRLGGMHALVDFVGHIGSLRIDSAIKLVMAYITAEREGCSTSQPSKRCCFTSLSCYLCLIWMPDMDGTSFVPCLSQVVSSRGNM